MQNPLPAMQNFIFGGNTGTPTVESLKKRREIADMLAAQTVNTPYRNWGDGVGSLMKAVGYRMMDNKLAPQEDDARKRIAEAITGLSGGSYTPSYAGPTAEHGGGFTGAPGGSYRDAIASIESAGSGDYSALGPVTKSGDRAYGRYQVMGANIPDWTKEALGQALTPEQFAASPQAQDAVFDHRFGGYVDKYGPAGAASMWFSGDPTPDGSADQLGTSDSDYVSKFMGALGGGGMASMMPREPDMGKVGQIAELLSNPYATDGQKMVLQALLQREMSTSGADPLDYMKFGLDQQRLQLDRDKFAAGTREGPKYYGNVQWAQRPNPETGEMETVPYQIGTDGTVNYLDLGGAQPLQPTRNVDLGTQQAQVGQAGGQVVNSLDKDIRGTQAATIAGEAQGQAAAGLPDFQLQVREASDLIDRIVKNPALDNAFGVINSRLPTVRQDTANVEADVEQLKSQVFPMAIQALKGLGAMSNMEGDAFAKSVASLDFRRDPKAAIAELNRLRGVLAEKMQIAEAKAKGEAPAADGGSIPDWMLNSDPATWTPEQQAEAMKRWGIGQ